MAAPGKKRRPGARSKASAQKQHAIRRCAERYGIQLTAEHYQTLCNSIKSGIGVCLGRQSLRLSVWRISVIDPRSLTRPGPAESITCNVVYDTDRGRIVTFLPPGITDAKGVAL